MLRSLVILVALCAVAAPSMAAVTLTGTSTGMTATIGYNYDGTGALPRAFALRITTSAGTISAVNKIKTADGVSTQASPGYGVFPGTIDIAADGSVTTYGSPVEPATLPGSGATGIGTNAVVVAMGSLYKGDPNKPLNAANLVSVTVAGTTTATLTITPETTYRKGVVGEDAAAITIANPSQTLTIGLSEPPPTECVKDTAPFYADWVAFGKPSCWCFPRNCKGDADGQKVGAAGPGYAYVTQADMNILIAGWNVKEAPKGSGIMSKSYNGFPAICADFARNSVGAAGPGYARVSQADLNLLIASWNVKEAPKGSGVAPCDMVNYNFFY